MEKEFDAELKKIENRKATGLNEIPPEVWKTRKFDGILLWLYNTVHELNIKEKWTKSCTLCFPKKGDFRITKNYRGITLMTLATNVYNVLFLNCLQQEIEKILSKNQNSFQRNYSTISQILIIQWLIKGIQVKILKAKLLFIDFSKAFDSIHRGKIEQILLA